MSFGKANVRYYMPLTKEGPSTSVFSVPRVQYSPETEATVKNLMRESRLTFTQKHVFETILRDGRSLPSQPGQVMRAQIRQNMMQNRHKHKARQMGIPLIEEDFNNAPYKFHTSNISMMYGLPARRSLDAIRASGDLEPLPAPKYCAVNKDAEKDKLAHKMAYGKDMINSPFAFQEKYLEKKPVLSRVDSKKSETVSDLKEQRVEELIDEIQDRMQFLLTMDQAKKGKEYKDCIRNQINEKLHEMRLLSPEKEKDIRDCLELELFDKRIAPTNVIEHRSSKFFD